jgi:hypothetical protein
MALQFAPSVLDKDMSCWCNIISYPHPITNSYIATNQQLFIDPEPTLQHYADVSETSYTCCGNSLRCLVLSQSDARRTLSSTQAIEGLGVTRPGNRTRSDQASQEWKVRRPRTCKDT